MWTTWTRPSRFIATSWASPFAPALCPSLLELEHEPAALILCQAERPARTDYPNAAGTVVGIATTNVAARAKELAAKKVDLVHATPQEFPGGTFIALRDPAGNVLELLEFSE